MQVILHAGAHFTDEDRLVKCLSANRQTLTENGTDVPSPITYRKPIRNVIQAAQKSGVTDDDRATVMDKVVTGARPERLVLSSAGFFGTPKMSAAGGVLYSAAEERIKTFHDLFPKDQVELFFAMCNPATFLPAVFAKTSFENIADFLNGTDPATIRWSDMLTRIRADHPNMLITVWCNEDTPLIWSQILREMGGLDPTVALEGEFSFLSQIMSAPGMKRFKSYLDSHPNMTETQKRRVIAAFLDKFAEETAIEAELDVPGWTDALVDQLTDIYDDDVMAIERMSGVNFITP